MTDFFPSLNSFTKQYNQNKHCLVWRTIAADLYTPVSVALRFYRKESYFSLFESVEKVKSRSRYSCIAMQPDLVWQCNGEGKTSILGDYDATIVGSQAPLEQLASLLDAMQLEIPDSLPSIAGSLFGYMGYDMVRFMEELPDQNSDVLHIPASIFFRPKIVIIFDNVKDEMIIITHEKQSGDNSAEEAYTLAKGRIEKTIEELSKPIAMEERHVAEIPASNKDVDFSKISSNCTKPEFCSRVDKAKEYIKAGDIFQVVLSQRFSMPYKNDAFLLYRTLRRLNPSPYSFFMKFEEFSLVGSSPETLVKIESGEMTVRPIAGTRWRGKDAEEDQALASDLLQDEKECAEHLMLLDLGRNDVGRVSEVGSVNVSERMHVDYYSHVMHLVSKVKGKIKSGVSPVEVLQAGFPAGTVSGAPKIRAMEIIDELENEKRSFYAGAVGYISANGDMDTCIALRTGMVKDDMFYVQAGGGIVADSVPEAEYQESQNKAKALLLAAQIVEGDRS